MKIYYIDPENVPGMAKVRSNCKENSDFVMGRDWENFYINRQHPHAKELAQIAFTIMHEVRHLDTDNERGFKLLNRAEVLSNKDASNALREAWSYNRDQLNRAEAEQEARRWIETTGKIDPDMRSELFGYDSGFLTALYHVVEKDADAARKAKGLPEYMDNSLEKAAAAVYYYGYLCGQNKHTRTVAAG